MHRYITGSLVLQGCIIIGNEGPRYGDAQSAYRAQVPAVSWAAWVAGLARRALSIGRTGDSLSHRVISEFLENT